MSLTFGSLGWKTSQLVVFCLFFFQRRAVGCLKCHHHHLCPEGWFLSRSCWSSRTKQKAHVTRNWSQKQLFSCSETYLNCSHYITCINAVQCMECCMFTWFMSRAYVRLVTLECNLLFSAHLPPHVHAVPQPEAHPAPMMGHMRRRVMRFDSRVRRSPCALLCFCRVWCGLLVAIKSIYEYFHTQYADSTLHFSHDRLTFCSQHQKADICIMSFNVSAVNNWL